MTGDNGCVSQPTAQRPPQATLASSIVMFASVVVLLTAFERVSTLGSLETQQSIRDVLGESPFSSLGLDLDGATQLLRVGALVAAAGACATAILGWYVRKPDRSARLGLSICAVPVFVSGLSIGGLAASFVAAGTAMLWLAPSREWFATGRWTPPTPPEKTAKTAKTAKAGRTGTVGTWTGAVASRSAPPAAAPHEQVLHARPAAMVAAFVITVVTAGGLLTLSLLWVAIASLSPEFLRSVLEQQPGMFDEGLTFDQVRDTVIAFASAFIVWCVVALVLAGFAMARRDWARRGLMIIAAFSAGGCLFFVLDTPLAVLPAMAAVATVVCLRRVEVRRWFSLQSR